MPLRVCAAWLALGTVAASWAGVPYAHLGDSHLVLLGKPKFVLAKGSDGYQVVGDAEAFRKWASTHGLPTDATTLVGRLDKADEVALEAELKVSGTEAAPKVQAISPDFRDLATPEKPGPEEAKSRQKFLDDLIKRMDLPDRPTLLVKLAGSSGDLTPEEAWKRLFSRTAKYGSAYVVNGKHLLWAHTDPAWPAATSVTSPGGTTVRVDGVTKPKSQEALGTPWVLVAAVAAGVLAFLGAIAWLLLRRRNKPTPTRKPSKLAEEKLGPLEVDEQELVRFVRQQRAQPSREGNNFATPTDVVVGKMMDAYRQYPKVSAERDRYRAEAERLDQYRRFGERAEEFRAESARKEETIRSLARERDAARAQISELKTKLNEEQSRSEVLEDQIREAEEILGKSMDWARTIDEQIEQILQEGATG